MSQYLMRYCSTAWDHLDQCPKHQFLQDPPKLTQVSPSSSFPVYLQGQRNNHKAQVKPLPLWGFPNILPRSGLRWAPPKSTSLSVVRQLKSLGQAQDRYVSDPAHADPKQEPESTRPFCRSVSALERKVGSAIFHPLLGLPVLLKNFLHSPTETVLEANQELKMDASYRQNPALFHGLFFLLYVFHK